MDTTSTHDDGPTPEVIEFTTPKARARETVTTKVTLCGEDLHARRPKDAVLFFAQSAMSEIASDSDRAMAMLQILDASCDSVSRHRILERACDRQDPVTAQAVYQMIEALTERWSPETKTPADHPVVVNPSPDAAPQADPVRIVNEDLDLDLVCHPPKDLILHITSSGLARGAGQGQQAWCVMLFLDAALSQSDAVSLSQRMRRPNDPLDLEALMSIIETLMKRWYPDSAAEGTRAQRRAKASRDRKKKSGTQQVPAGGKGPQQIEEAEVGLPRDQEVMFSIDDDA